MSYAFSLLVGLSSLVEMDSMSLSTFAIIAGLDYLLASFSNCFFQGLGNDGKNSWIIYFRNDVAGI